jgi:PAS domain S-box-containing protein
MPTRLSVLGVSIPENAIQVRRVLPAALILMAALTAVEWYYRFDFSLGVLYMIPVLLASAALNRWQIVLFGLFAAFARAPFTPAASGLEVLLKFTMAAIAYTGTGLLVVEMSNNRRRLLESFARVKMEQELRRHAEAQLQTLADSSPAAILTLNAQTMVLAANRAAHEILGYPPDTLVGSRIGTCLPVLGDALKVAARDRPIRTSVTGWAKRRDDQIIPIQAWFSVYDHGEGRCLAAIVVDTSEEVRDRERENFQHLLDYNRLLAGAVSHEIRNFCSAISVVCSNLSARTDLRANADFDALVRLVDGLLRLASFELRHKSGGQEPRADLKGVVDQLRIVIEPDWEEIDGQVIWQLPGVLPAVKADAHGLLQIFLNLCQNSVRAAAPMPERRLTVSIASTSEDAVVTFSDSGPGVENPEALFHLQTVRPENGGSGLGLYISRELARSFGGELQHVPTPRGGEFRVVVPLAHATVVGELCADR